MLPFNFLLGEKPRVSGFFTDIHALFSQFVMNLINKLHIESSWSHPVGCLVANTQVVTVIAIDHRAVRQCDFNAISDAMPIAVT